MGRYWDGDCVEDDYEDPYYDKEDIDDEEEGSSCGCENGCCDCLGIRPSYFY